MLIFWIHGMYSLAGCSYQILPYSMVMDCRWEAIIAYHVHIFNSRDVKLRWLLLSNATIQYGWLLWNDIIQHGYGLQMGSYSSLPCSYFEFDHRMYSFAGCYYHTAWLYMGSYRSLPCSLVDITKYTIITKYISAYRLRNRRQYKKASLIVIIRSTIMYIFAWNLGK